MDKERWQLISRTYHAALELDGQARSRFLDEACGNDQELRNELEALISYDGHGPSFMESPAAEVAARWISEDDSGSIVGRQLGSYKIISQVAAGGMGEVYVAEDPKLNRKVAIKVILARSIADEQAQKRLRREAQAAARLEHPNICAIYEVGQQDDISFIAMQYIEGETLASRIGKLPLTEALEISIQIASALSAAHAQNIIHRDIKPQNILISANGQSKVLDFGLAKMIRHGELLDGAGAAEVFSSTPGVLIGTPAYMSPEQIRGENLDARSDIFSFGSMLYEMATGQHPYVKPSPGETLSAILTIEPAPLAQYVPDVPEELERIVRKAIAKSKDARYQRIDDLLKDLRALKEELDFEAKFALTTGESIKRANVDRTFGTTRLTKSASAIRTGDRSLAGTSSFPQEVLSQIARHKILSAIGAVIIISAAALGYHYVFRTSRASGISSLAVLPFRNESGSSDVDYLSDGMSESLINNLSELPGLSVKAQSSVVRYKGRQIEPQQVASELSVQAILNGRFIQRGDDLVLYLSLVDGRTGNQIWGEQYNRKSADIVSLQLEIAHDVSQKLSSQLSGAAEQKLARTYTANAEAYRLYLKGRYHLAKITPPEIQIGISYFKQGIEMDQAYALAYVGLADSYRTLALVGEVHSNEAFPSAKAAAQKAIEIDDSLASAHAELGLTVFWYDWDWTEAEKQLTRAIELEGNNAEAHEFYAHLLSNIGRHAEALAQIRQARALAPFDLRMNGLGCNSCCTPEKLTRR